MEAVRARMLASAQQLLRSRAFGQAPIKRFQQLHIQPTFRSRPTTSISQSRNIHTAFRRPAKQYTSPLRGTRPRRWQSTEAESESGSLSFSQRMKKLSREYGWAAVYVYFGLSLLDFPFCFLAVRLIGTDTIGHWEHVIVTKVKSFLQWPLGGDAQEVVAEVVDKASAAVEIEEKTRILEEDGEAYEVTDHGYNDAARANSGSDASLWTQLALAYAIHKSFIFVRIPLTAAVLPKIVKTLRGWGWNIGRPSRKAITGSNKTSSKTGVNTKKSGVKSDD